MSPRDLSIFTGLPDNVLQEVFRAFLCREGQFADDPEVYETSRNQLLTQRYATVATAIMPACRRFYDLGVRLLWRSVVIRSSRGLLSVARSACLGGNDGELDLLCLIKRIEIHLSSCLDIELVQALMECLTDLEVIMVCGGESATHLPDESTSFFGFLAAPYPYLRRLQIESDNLVPSFSQLVGCLRTNTSLLTVRIKRMSNVGAADRATTLTRAIPHLLKLNSLSFGDIFADNPPSVSDPFNALLTWLARPHGSDHALAPVLRNLEAYTIPDALGLFLRVYGSRLQRLRFTATAYRIRSPTVCPQWADLCPNLEQLDWVTTGSYTERLPPEHPHISKVCVLYLKSRFDNREHAIARSVKALEALTPHRYPRLRAVELVMGGDSIPPVDELRPFCSDMSSAAVLVGGTGWSLNCAVHMSEKA